MIRDFQFPFPPYTIQIDFMNNLYNCLSTGKGGLFESPTGTGKTLSIICGSLTFLSDHLRSLSEPKTSTESPLKAKKAESVRRVPLHSLRKNISPEVNPRIVYLTRTHSQLDQFTKELKQTIWGQNNFVRLVRLASRSQICVNQEVNKEKSLIDYNCKLLNSKFAQEDEIDVVGERKQVEEMKGKPLKQGNLLGFVKIKKKMQTIKEGCKYFSAGDFASQLILGKICDIEDLVALGQENTACPYYGSRNAMKNADIILAPYSSILNQRNRKNIGLDLKDCFVVIDESHNIINAITECHSGTILERQINSCLNCIEVYRRTYIEKMLPRKIMYVDLSLRILRSLKNFIERNKTRDYHYEERKTFIERYNLQNINFFDIWDYYEEQALPLKIFNVGFKTETEAKNDLAALKNFHEFILSLEENDGEFLISKDTQGNFTLKFLLLNPFNKFRILLQEASCIVLAGGTLTPRQEFNQLFSSLERSQFVNFSCEHVVPAENLILTTISTSLKGEELKFTYGNREDLSLFTNLGDILCNLCQIVPHGIVVFLPSYSFLTKIQEILMESHIPQMMQRKEVFFDNRDENILKEYSGYAEKRGAILFAVIRGSLSEGINFSDRLGRCVVIVGMPYLNSFDPEVIVKKIYYDKTDWYSGQQYYENSCDVAINQSIGRAIRHARDFAAIVLVDSRHCRRISSRPNWMIRSAVDLRKVEDVFSRVRQFFRSKINKT